METSLHRELKHYYAGGEASVEVDLEGYRIDAIDEKGTLVEIQHAGLSSIRDKVKRLLAKKHPLKVVKPIVRSKWIETYDKPHGNLIRSRKSPKRGAIVDVFRELIHFTNVFPAPKLTIEIVEVDCIEKRVDRKNRRWKRKSYQTFDQLLVSVGTSTSICIANDLWTLLNAPVLSETFDTQDLAVAINQPRWFAQQVAYVLRHCGAVDECGKRGNSILYRQSRQTKRSRNRAA